MTNPNGWQTVKLGDIFAERTETNCDLELLSVTGTRGIIPRSEIEGKDSSSEDKSKYLKVCEGDIAYNTMRMWQGVSALSDYEGIVSPAYTVLKANENTCAEYFQYLFKLQSMIFKFYRWSQGLVDDQRSLKYHNFAIISVDVPPLPEQRAIAEILTTQDNLIALKQRLIDAKKQQKRWLMQNLLTSKVRLPGFNGEWEDVCLGELGELERGNGLQKSDFVDSGVGCIHYGQIYTYYTETAYETKSFVTESLAKYLNTVHSNDLIITATSENVEDVCKTVAWLGKTDIVTGGHTIIFRHNENAKFLSYYTNTRSFFDEKRKYARGTKVIEISVNDTAKIRLLLPHLAEQTAIAERLTTTDCEITLLTRELEQQKLIKKYLMQQLLTGRKRVSV